MNDLLIPAALGLALALVVCLALARLLIHIARRRYAKRRSEGHRLIHALGAYSAWIDAQRDTPFHESDLEELTSPAPLTHAREIRNRHFPQLSTHMVRLLQAHSRVIEYLWQQNLLRLSQATGWRPAHQDARYQQLRGAQEELIDEIVVNCRKAIGEVPQAWKATSSDYAFRSTLSMMDAGPATRV